MNQEPSYRFAYSEINNATLLPVKTGKSCQGNVERLNGS
jgi:hypothetical protein